MRINISLLLLIFIINSISFWRTIHFVNINRLSLGKSWIVYFICFKVVIFTKLLWFEVYHFYMVIEFFFCFIWTFIDRFLMILISVFFWSHARYMNFNMWEFMFSLRFGFLNKDSTRLSKPCVSITNLFGTLLNKPLFGLLRNFSLFF